MKQCRFRTYRQEAEVARTGATAILGETRVVSLRWGRFGAIWSHPTAVTVVRAGRAERIPVVDVTQVAVFALLGAALLVWLWAFLRRLMKG